MTIKANVLNEWIPFPVTSMPDVVINYTIGNAYVYSKNLEYDKELLKGKINFLQAKGIIRCQIPVGSIRKHFLSCSLFLIPLFSQFRFLTSK